MTTVPTGTAALGLIAATVDELTSILDLWAVAVDTEVLPYYREVFELGGYSAVARMAELGGRRPDEIAEVLQPYLAEASARHLAAARDRLLRVGDEAWAQARRVMLDGLDHGQPIDTIAANLRNVTSLTTAQATMVARTEVISAANAGAFEQARLAGDEAPLYKTWLATRDPRTRPTHMAADGQTVPLNDSFAVGIDHLLHPGDPTGSFEEVINCRCTVIFGDDPAGLDVDISGRQEGGVVADVAEEPERTLADFHGAGADLPIPDAHGLDDIRAALAEFIQLDAPYAPGGGTPTVEWLEYEQQRRRIGGMLDQLIRDELGEMPTELVPGGDSPLDLRRRTEQLHQQQAEWIDDYRFRLRDHLRDLGIDFVGDAAGEGVAEMNDAGRAMVVTLVGDAQRTLAQVATSLPRKWVEHLQVERVDSLVVNPALRDGAWYDSSSRQIVVSNPYDISSVIHEINHHLATNRRNVHASEWTVKWLRETSVDPEGNVTWEALVQNPRMAEAIERPDVYPLSYMGRQYRPGGVPTGYLTNPTDYGELWTSTVEPLLNYQTPAHLSRPWRVGYLQKLFTDRQITSWALSVLMTL